MTIEKERVDGKPLEVNLIELSLHVWKKKYWMAGATLLFGALGAFVAATSPRVFQSVTILAPKEASGGSQASFIAGLGGLGGMMAQRMGLGSNSVDHLEVLILSRGLAERVIAEHDFMPRMFPKRWDAVNKKWKVTEKRPAPKPSQAAAMLRGGYVTVNADEKRKLISINVRSSDKQLSQDIGNAYLLTLNRRMRDDIRADAAANRRFLESQLTETVDPLIREKIQQLMAAEIERSMIVSSSTFTILEPPTLAEFPIKPKKRMILMIYLASGFFLSFMLVTFWKLGGDALAAYRPLIGKD